MPKNDKMDVRLRRVITDDLANTIEKPHNVLVTVNDDEGPPDPELTKRGLRQVVTGIYIGMLLTSHILELEALDCVTSIEGGRRMQQP